MGKRREPRKPVELPARIFGTDRAGHGFSENVTTVDVSQHGARLTGVKAQLNLEEVIGVTYGKNKVHFRVKWTGKPDTPTESQTGLLNLAPEKPFWDFPLPDDAVDGFRIAIERRKSPRVKCSISAEVRPHGQSVIRGKASDLSVGGCFVEMPVPLAVNTKLDIALWLKDNKLHLQGEVASAAPGYGIGMRFTKVSAEGQEMLQRHIQSISAADGTTRSEQYRE